MMNGFTAMIAWTIGGWGDDCEFEFEEDVMFCDFLRVWLLIFAFYVYHRSCCIVYLVHINGITSFVLYLWCVAAFSPILLYSLY
jgi:hypothetical protein